MVTITRWACANDQGKLSFESRPGKTLAQDKARMLTKSDLLSARQCPRQLWLAHRRPDLVDRDHPASWRRANDGRIVGERARAALGAGVLWPAGDPDPAVAAVTALRQLQASPSATAVEFPAVAGPLYVRADALLPSDDGHVLSETKAKTFPLKSDKITPAEPEDHLIADVAIQLWTFTNAGIPVVRAELNLLNGRWRYPGNGDYQGLFRTLDVTGPASALLDSVPTWAADAAAILAGEMPTAVTGKQCSTPYDCPFTTFCRPLDPPGPEHPLELLPDAAGKGLAKKLKAAKGYVSILEPAEAELTGAQALLYRRIQQAHRNGAAVRGPGCEQILGAYPYPAITWISRQSTSPYRVGPASDRTNTFRSNGRATSNGRRVSSSTRNFSTSQARTRPGPLR